MLWYLHLCAINGVTVIDYVDRALGTMEEDGEGGRFVGVELRPIVTISSGDRETALRLHGEAHRLCFIARSVNFPVDVEAQIA